MARKPAPSKMSSNPKSTPTTRKAPGAAPRAHREDTWEAKTQTDRMPKAHPTRNPSPRRKDK